MIVCVDSGNSRIKWGVHDGQGWLAQGVAEHADAVGLSDLQREWPIPERVLLANVAGPEAGLSIRRQLGGWLPVLTEVHSQAKACGVTNFYKNPEQLGVDRWCALVGAWRRLRSAAIVVMAGTATTVDTLDANGNFCGGLILPGIELMCQALAYGTAKLPLAKGEYRPCPRSTDDAIFSGAVEAQAGAIERALARLDDPSAVCLLSGGQAEAIAQHLAVPVQVAHNLPLDGMLQISGEIR